MRRHNRNKRIGRDPSPPPRGAGCGDSPLLPNGLSPKITGSLRVQDTRTGTSGPLLLPGVGRTKVCGASSSLCGRSSFKAGHRPGRMPSPDLLPRVAAGTGGSSLLLPGAAATSSEAPAQPLCRPPARRSTLQAGATGLLPGGAASVSCTPESRLNTGSAVSGSAIGPGSRTERKQAGIFAARTHSPAV